MRLDAGMVLSEDQFRTFWALKPATENSRGIRVDDLALLRGLATPGIVF